MEPSKPIAVCLIAVLLLLIGSIESSINIPSTASGLVSEVAPNTFSEANNFASTDYLVNADYRTKILFVGDVMLARNVEILMNKYGASYPYLGVNFANLSTNSFVVGNFESSIPRIHSPTKILKMSFSVDKKFLPDVKNAGFTHFSLANNHALDYGQLDFENTKTQLQSSGIEAFGHPKSLSTDSVSFLQLKNISISIIGLHTLEKDPTLSEIEDIFSYATQKSDYQIVYVHWGTEYATKSSFAQNKLATQLVASGADMIIGHHPHVVQEVELIDGVPVFYSLGNYIFDQYFSLDVQEGLVLQLDFSDQLLVRLVPVTSKYSRSQPAVMSDLETSAFLNKLSEKSDAQLRESIKMGIITLNTQFASSSKMAIISK